MTPIDRVALRERMSEWLTCFLGEVIDVPPLDASEALLARLAEYDFELVYLADVEVGTFRANWAHPLEGRYWQTSIVERVPLPGRWVAVERLPIGSVGPLDAGDHLGRALGLASRFGSSWDALHERVLPAAAALLGVVARLPHAIERNLIGKLWHWANVNGPTALPDWHEAQTWEWSESRYGRYHRLLVGRGGLGAVGWCFSGDEWYGIFGLRVLVPLNHGPCGAVAKPSEPRGQ